MALWNGMETDGAKVVMQNMIAKKGELSAETSNANTSIQEQINSAFAGDQVFAMQGYVDRLNNALQELYKYIDGNESSFAQNLNEYIVSYETSDTNVAQGYNSSGVN